MTQAAVSYQMKLLEERLGAPLFARSGRGIALTEHGRRIAPQVTSAFDTMGEAFGSVRVESETVLTISAPRTFATNWLAGRIGSFQVARPELAVRLHVGDEIVDLAAGDADMGIRGAPAPWPGLVSHFVMGMPVTPMASPLLLAAHPPVREAADVLKLPRLSSDDDWWDLWIECAVDGAPEGKSPPSIRFESQILDGSAAIAGHGVAILSPPMWQTAIDAGQLVPVHPHFVNYRNGFWLVYPESKRSLAKIRAFRDWLLAEVATALRDDPYGALVPPGAGQPS